MAPQSQISYDNTPWFSIASSRIFVVPVNAWPTKPTSTALTEVSTFVTGFGFDYNRIANNQCIVDHAPS